VKCAAPVVARLIRNFGQPTRVARGFRVGAVILSRIGVLVQPAGPWYSHYDALVLQGLQQCATAQLPG